MPNHVGECVANVGMSRLDDVMIRAEIRRHLLLKFAFVKLLVAERNRKRIQPTDSQLPHDGRDDRRIQSATQVCPH